MSDNMTQKRAFRVDEATIKNIEYIKANGFNYSEVIRTILKEKAEEIKRIKKFRAAQTKLGVFLHEKN